MRLPGRAHAIWRPAQKRRRDILIGEAPHCSRQCASRSAAVRYAFRLRVLAKFIQALMMLSGVHFGRLPSMPSDRWE